MTVAAFTGTADDAGASEVDGPTDGVVDELESTS